MSLALYRKYRPKNLDEVVAQDPIITTLKAALDKGLLGHALLLIGPRGVGKTSLARILAHQVNQVEYDLDKTPLDIIEIDAASNGRIDEVRDLREKIKLMPIELQYKVYIIDEVHMLTKEAFNALLKTLEEPPKHIIFIMATTEIHKIPATIISRCQRFAFKTIPQEDLKKHLKKISDLEKIKIDDTALDLLAQHAQGGLRDALSLLDQLASLKQKITAKLVEEMLGLPSNTEVENLLKALQAGSLKDVIKCYQNLDAQGVDPIILTGRLTESLRNNLEKNPNSPDNFKSLDLFEDLLNVFSAKKPHATLEITLLKHTGSKVK